MGSDVKQRIESSFHIKLMQCIEPSDKGVTDEDLWNGTCPVRTNQHLLTMLVVRIDTLLLKRNTEP